MAWYGFDDPQVVKYKEPAPTKPPRDYGAPTRGTAQPGFSTNEPANDLGRLIREFRHKRNESMEVCADRAGVYRDAWMRWELGRFTLNRRRVTLISRTLGLTAKQEDRLLAAGGFRTNAEVDRILRRAREAGLLDQSPL